MIRLTERPSTRIVALVALWLASLVVHHRNLRSPTLHFDEGVFVGAARIVASGGSPYDHPVYNYPPALAELAATWLERERELVVAVRALNLAACSALAWFAAGFAGLRTAGRLMLALLLVVGSPLVREALWLGNLAPIPVLLALVAWSIGAGRPFAAGMLQATSLALKPLALVGIAFATLRRATARRFAETVWVAAGVLVLTLPWLGLLPELLRRMAQPPIFSSRNLSLRRALLAAGVDLPAPWIALAVLAVALWLCRRRPFDASGEAHAAGVVSLLALPVAWPHGFLIVLPLQVEAARIWWDRRGVRSGADGGSRLAERWGVPLALVAIQASAASGVEFAAPELAQLPIVLVPALAPVALLAYRLRFGGRIAAAG